MSQVAVNDIFLPASTDLVDGMVADYKRKRNALVEIDTFMHSPQFIGMERYFLDKDNGVPRHLSPLTDAIAVLNSETWDNALRKTDVLEVMPQARIDEWNKQIREYKCPDFDEEVVRETILSLLNRRMQFFAERVDGVFKVLSGEHVTNRPEGFYKRMIIAGVIDNLGLVSSSRAGYIRDLRYVVARLRGMAEPKNGMTSHIISTLQYHYGEWIEVDGGSMRIKLFKKGTAHLEVHPDLAWQLNQILAQIYPRAIPPAFREKPKKQFKECTPMQDFLPYEVTAELVNLNFGKDDEVTICNWFSTTKETDKHVKARVARVLEALGGVKVSAFTWRFDYDPIPTIKMVAVTGRIPDKKSHQYYPTPENIATQLIALADIKPNESILEPSAGQGHIYDLFPADRILMEYGASNPVTLVELSQVHCSILEQRLKHKSHRVINTDFVKWAGECNTLFDVVVMNPPFSEGRAELHTSLAAKLLTSRGRVVSVMPASFGLRNKQFIPGCHINYSTPFSNEFEGTSMAVVIAKITPLNTN